MKHLKISLLALSMLLSASASAKREKILFMGSSTIAHWTTLQADFPQDTPINEGVNGTTFQYLIDNGAHLVKKHKPDRVMIYSGDNDLGNGESPKQVVADFEKTVAVLRTAAPKVLIDVISIKPSPGRANLLKLVQATNEQLKQSAARAHVAYIDTHTAMLTSQGKIRAELFDQSDESLLHMNGQGYKLWTSIILRALGERRAP